VLNEAVGNTAGSPDVSRTDVTATTFDHLIDMRWEIERQISGQPDLARRDIVPDGSTRRCNRCTSRARWFRPETHNRHPPHIVARLRRVQALLHLQTVNAQKNMLQDFKSNWDRVIR